MVKNGEGSCEDIEQGYNADDHHHDETNSDEGFEEDCRESSVAESSLGCDDVESISCSEVKLSIVERDCRICHLGLMGKDVAASSGGAIMLGCSCKDDLGVAHRQCAETWFKIKGNKICEICGSTARNIIGSVETETIEEQIDVHTSTTSVTPSSETRRFWQGHRFLNFLLACLVFAFVISWLFHFNVPG